VMSLHNVHNTSNSLNHIHHACSDGANSKGDTGLRTGEHRFDGP
jgi:hypothetical protein